MGRRERLGLRRERAAETILGLGLLVLRAPQRDEGDDARDDRRDREERQRAERDPPHPPATLLGRARAPRSSASRAATLASRNASATLGEPDVGAGAPLERGRQRRAAVQQVRIPLLRAHSTAPA